MSRRFGLCVIIAVALAVSARGGEIHDAARRDAADQIKALLTADGDLVNAVDDDGNTPLHCAAEANATKACVELIARGAMLDVKNAKGLTPFQVAVRTGASAVVELLTKRTPAVYREASLDATIERGEKAFNENDLLQAYNIFNVLLKRDPGNERINFGLGLTCRSLGDLGRAQMAF